MSGEKDVGYDDIRKGGWGECVEDDDVNMK
jgi:hypothetical protein